VNPDRAASLQALLAIGSGAPDAAKSLKRVVLDLAVRGQLVFRRTSPGGQDALRSALQDGRARLSETSALPRPRYPTNVPVTDPPFPVPDGWTWLRLGDVAAIVGGGTPPTKVTRYWAVERGIPWVTPADMSGQQSRFVTRGRRDITPSALEERSINLLPAGSVLFSSRAPIGHVGIAANPLTTNRGFRSCIPYVPAMGEYLYLFLRQAGRHIDAAASGTTFREVSGTDLALTMIPVPPLEEQADIIAETHRLLDLVDQHERAERLARRSGVAARDAWLSSLVSPSVETPGASAHEQFKVGVHRLIRNSDDVFALRRTVLDLAVRGLLTGDPNIVGGRRHPQADMSEQSGPFRIPENWAWSRLGDVFAKITDGTHHSPPNGAVGEYRYVTAKDIKDDGVSDRLATYVSAEVHAEIYARCDPEYEDVLYIKDGATTGVVTVNNLREPFSMLSSVALLKPGPGIDPWYATYAMRSPFFYQQTRGRMAGVGIPRVTLRKLKEALLPVPPIDQQRAVAAQVKHLMSRLDDLAKALETSRVTQSAMLEVLAATVEA
jgi:type I restriction enzyme S subunit